MAITAFPYTAVLDVSANSLLGNNTGSTAAAIALTASQVRTLLSVYTSAQVDSLLAGYQPLDADLTAIAALTTTSFGRSLLTQADAAATRTTIGAGTSSFSGAYGDLSGIPGTFTPSAHKTSHATGGSDALTAADIGAVPTARTLTINGTTQDLSADRTFTISAGVTGTTGTTNNAVLFATAVDGVIKGTFTAGATTGALTVVDGLQGPQIRIAGVGTVGVENALGNCRLVGSVVVLASSNLQPQYYSTNDLTLGATDGGCFVAGAGANATSRGFWRGAGGFHIQGGTYGLTTASSAHVYNTYTSLTSYERLSVSWASNECTIEVTKGSAGGTLRGLKIGGASTSLLGFYGATPVDRPDTVADPTGGSTIDAEARTAINAIIDRLQELGLIA